MTSTAPTVDAYLDSLPDDRRAAVRGLRDAIRAHLPPGYAEGMGYGMLSWHVPHSVYAPGYHCDPKQPVPFVGVGSQKQHVAVYLFCIYVDEALQRWFVEEYGKTGRKLDMGKGCVRFRKLDEIPFELIGRTVERMPVDVFLAKYTSQIPASKKKKTA